MSNQLSISKTFSLAVDWIGTALSWAGDQSIWWVVGIVVFSVVMLLDDLYLH